MQPPAHPGGELSGQSVSRYWVSLVANQSVVTDNQGMSLVANQSVVTDTQGMG